MYKVQAQGTSVVVQWLELHASTAGGTGSILGQGTKIPVRPNIEEKIKCKPDFKMIIIRVKKKQTENSVKLL